MQREKKDKVRSFVFTIELHGIGKNVVKAWKNAIKELYKNPGKPPEEFIDEDENE